MIIVIMMIVAFWPCRVHILERLRQVLPSHRLLFHLSRRLPTGLPRLGPREPLDRLRHRIIESYHRVLPDIQNHRSSLVSIWGQDRHIDVGNTRREDFEGCPRRHRKVPATHQDRRMLVGRIGIGLAIDLRGLRAGVAKLESLEIDRSSIGVETLAKGDPEVGRQVVGGESLGQGQVLSGGRGDEHDEDDEDDRLEGRTGSNDRRDRNRSRRARISLRNRLLE